MLGDHAVEGLDVLQCPAHEHGVPDAVPVVGEDPDARRRVRHCAQLREPLAAQADRDRTDRCDVAPARLSAQPPDLLDHSRRVGDGIGVGHRVDRGIAPQRGAGGAALDRLGVLATWLAQVRVQVDQPGKRDQPVGVDHLGCSGVAGGLSAGGDDRLAIEQKIGRRAAEGGGTLDQVRAHASTSRPAVPAGTVPVKAGSLPPSSR